MAKISKTIVLGRPEAIWVATTWSESPVSAVVSCHAQVNSVTYKGEEVIETEYYAEVQLAMNPRTGSAYDFEDPIGGTTAFEEEDTYDDLSRYQQTLGVVAEFDFTFSNTGLSGDQYAVASTAFQLSQLGYEICILALPEEADLIRFTQERGWSFRIVSSKTA